MKIKEFPDAEECNAWIRWANPTIVSITPVPVREGYSITYVVVYK